MVDLDIQKRLFHLFGAIITGSQVSLADDVIVQLD